MENYETTNHNYYYDLDTNMLVHHKILTLHDENDQIISTITLEENQLEIPKDDGELLELLLKHSNYKIRKSYLKDSRLIREFNENSMNITINKLNNVDYIHIDLKGKLLIISNQQELDSYLDSLYSIKMANKKNNTPLKKSIQAIIFTFIIYFGVGLISFLIFEQDILILKIIYILALLSYQILLHVTSYKNIDFSAYNQFLINGVLFLIGIAIFILNKGESYTLESISYLLIYPIIFTFVFLILTTFLEGYINKFLTIILHEIEKRKLIKKVEKNSNTVFKKSPKRFILRILSIVLKITFIASLVIFLLDLEDKRIPDNIFTLLIIIIPTSCLLAYLSRYMMNGICIVCGDEVDLSSLDEKIIPSYTTSEMKYKDHQVKDDTGHILGYVTTETEIITEHPESIKHVEYYACENDNCALKGFEFNKHVSTLLWMLFGLW
jgi:hypothetical protein